MQIFHQFSSEPCLLSILGNCLIGRKHERTNNGFARMSLLDDDYDTSSSEDEEGVHESKAQQHHSEDKRHDNQKQAQRLGKQGEGGLELDTKRAKHAGSGKGHDARADSKDKARSVQSNEVREQPRSKDENERQPGQQESDKRQAGDQTAQQQQQQQQTTELQVDARVQQKVETLLNAKRTRNISILDKITGNKQYRNPSIYEKLIQRMDIDEFGECVVFCVGALVDTLLVHSPTKRASFELAFELVSASLRNKLGQARV